MRQCDLSPASSLIARLLKIATRIGCAASLLLPLVATPAAEQPQNPLAWRNYVNEVEGENMFPRREEIDSFPSLSSMRLHKSIAANQTKNSLAQNIPSAAARNWNNQISSFSVTLEHFFAEARVARPALVDLRFSLQMALRETTRVETPFQLYLRNTPSHSEQNSHNGFYKPVFLYFNDPPRRIKVAARRSRQVEIRTSHWVFYLLAATFLFGIALLGLVWVAVGKRVKPKRDRRRISDTYLKRVREIARFGSYKIRISKDSLRESNRWSAEMYSILRREPAQGPMRTSAYIARYVHPEDRPFVTEIYRKAIAGNSVECEYRIIVPGGEIRYIHDFLEYVSSDSTKKVFLGQMHDVTERWRMQQELDQTRVELRRSIAALESLRGKEQKRVAQEMHDDLGQLLAAMKIDLDDLGQSLPTNDTKMQRRLLALKDLVSAMIISVRRIVANLPPKGLEDLGLFEALTLMKQNFESRHRIPCHLKLPQEQPSLGREIASAIYRTVQESLSNIVKHANATRVSVELTADEHHITVCVIDNGKGLSPDASQKTESFGLIGMRERTIALEGEMKLESRKGGGTVVWVRLPKTQA